MSYLEGRIGPLVNAQDGGLSPVRMGKQGDLIKSDLHGKYYEQNYRGNLYAFGGSDTALAAVNAITTSGATAKPVIGLWNPSTSGMNLVILKAMVVFTTIGGTAVAPAGLFWVYSTGNSAISTGSTPVNLKTLLASGSVAKAFSVGTALTGLTNALSLLRVAAIGPCLNAAGPATAITQPQANLVEDVEGSIIVPPGGVAAIQVGVDVSAHASNVSTGIVWEEVPV